MFLTPGDNSSKDKSHVSSDSANLSSRNMSDGPNSKTIHDNETTARPVQNPLVQNV